MQFTHLHLHTQFSILDGAINIKELMEKIKETGMESVAITDHGNMYGVMDFYSEAKKKGIKPIIGCEVYVARRSRTNKKIKEDRSGHHLVLLAKNKKGYQNLIRIVSLGFLEGFYYKPRIDKEILRKYSDGIIASSACLGGELPATILKRGKEAGRKVVEEFKSIFGSDYYIEIQRHGHSEQNEVNPILIELAQESEVKIIATNDAHFKDKEDFEGHEILISLRDGLKLQEKKEQNKKEYYLGEEYVKTPQEMMENFSDIPQAIANTQEIVKKIEDYELIRDVILPIFPIPEGFDENGYLKHLAFEGAKNKYSQISPEVEQRLLYELKIIKEMGFSGYFLIVQDFINKALDMGVFVGPGRGSAAGSAVAYAIGITNIDPIKYNLLFERFLNPERVTMPDIDIDFDDEGREEVMKYVIEKYGSDKVAQIVTFGSMAAKSSIRDVGRVLDLPLSDSDRLAKMIPETPKITIKKALKEVPEFQDAFNKGSKEIQRTLKFAQILEGSVRNTGTHACGVIIGPEDLKKYVPISRQKGSEIPVTQYDGRFIESVGMLKMDFLGLKTLSIMKQTIEKIKIRHNKIIDLNNIPLDDKKTFELYQRGETIGTFQFESDGMRNHLKKLKPTNIEDLIAMNALYRPGPMEFIPLFIDRKHGKKEVKYPHKSLEELLKPTYGIMVYQEQIMRTAQIMGGFSLGKADLLRRAMGKKKMEIMKQQKIIFIEGAQKKGISEKKAIEVFDIMMEFAKYGFNRSHSAAYSLIAYQTAYLKAHYPAEYMASVLDFNMNDIKKVKFFIAECSNMGINVLGPDVNESLRNFSVNDKGELRFGMEAIKGVGGATVDSIVEERKKVGKFENLAHLTELVNLRAVNKRALENLAYIGAFDSFGTHRKQYFYIKNNKKNNENFIELTIKYANKFKKSKNSISTSVFGDDKNWKIPRPTPPECEEENLIDKLKKEEELLGFFVSGHPLDDYKREIKNIVDVQIEDINQKYLGKNVTIAGVISKAQERRSKNGNLFGIFTLEDYSGAMEFLIFTETYLKFKHFLEEGQRLMLKGKVEKKYNKEGLTIRIAEIKTLQDVKENYIKYITIKIDIDILNKDITTKIYEAVKENRKGKSKLIFNIYDEKNNLKLDLLSNNTKINPTDDFFDKIDKIKEIDYIIN